MNTIMVATDLSERSDRALRRATLLCKQFDTELMLIHVVDDDQPRRIVEAESREAKAILLQTAETLRDVDGVKCETQVIHATPFAGIVKAVEDATPDLLVIGHHRKQVLRDVFIGTTAERTIRSVSCPVLMVNASPAGKYRRVLLTTDLSGASRDALKRVPEIGLSRETRNTLLYVFDAPALRLAFNQSMPKDEREHYVADEQLNAQEDLDRFLSSLDLGNVVPMVRHEATRAQYEILEAAKATKADLIVLSTHGRTGLPKLLLGSITEQVLQSAPIDVLAIPPLRG